MSRPKIIITGLISLVLICTTWAEEVRVAVAANFEPPMTPLIELFEKETGHKALLLFGSTAKLYTQVHSGAPFDVLLAADTDTPARLERENAAVPGTRFTYARGRLVLWSADVGMVDAQGRVLKIGDFERLAIAAPKLAPYGMAAIETINYLGLMKKLRPKLVMSESVGQTYSELASENADLGFVALSHMVYEDGKLSEGSGWIVPQRMHRPLLQDAVMLVRAKNNPAARALLAFLKTDQAKTVMRSFGYEID
jgi:molybdate transport system substrate-binding protein